MPADMQDVRTRATQFANGFTSGQKAMSVLAVIAALVGGLIFFHEAGKPSYQPLFTGLKASDASAITSKLSGDGVPYQLADGGASVLVPGKDVDSERLAMSAAGLPSQGGGFSNLDKQGLTSSSASQAAAYQDDLQNELESTIESIQGVTSAQVAIALPQTDTFGVATASTTTASVLVGLGTGAALTSTQIQSIVHLVASAVPNLNASNVTVADTNGNMLAAPGVNTDDSGSACQTKAFDTAMDSSLDQLLATVSGAGNVDVQVASDLNCDKNTTTSNLVQTGKNGKPVVVPTSATSDKETFSGNGTALGGALGTTTTAPSTTTTGTSGAGAYVKTDSAKQFAVATVNSTVQTAPGQIRRLTVAVLLNTKANINPASVKSLVTAAAGIQTKRGDSVTVVSMPFSTASTTAAKAAATAAAKAKKSAGLLSIGRTALLVIGLIVLILLLLRGSKKERRTAVALPADGTHQLLAAHQASLDAAADRLAITGARPSKNTGDLNDFIDSSPDEIADLLRSWTREGVR
jgi:flagellar M-ring protein FliF